MASKRANDREIARACLRQICQDTEAKPADRVAAAKLLLGGEEATDGTLTVVLDNVPRDYLL